MNIMNLWLTLTLMTVGCGSPACDPPSPSNGSSGTQGDRPRTERTQLTAWVFEHVLSKLNIPWTRLAIPADDAREQARFKVPIAGCSWEYRVFRLDGPESKERETRLDAEAEALRSKHRIVFCHTSLVVKEEARYLWYTMVIGPECEGGLGRSDEELRAAVHEWGENLWFENSWMRYIRSFEP